MLKVIDTNQLGRLLRIQPYFFTVCFELFDVGGVRFLCRSAIQRKEDLSLRRTTIHFGGLDTWSTVVELGKLTSFNWSIYI